MQEIQFFAALVELRFFTILRVQPINAGTAKKTPSHR
jgi:hypothetical protein